jgi:hypothetical protein
MNTFRESQLTMTRQAMERGKVPHSLGLRYAVLILEHKNITRTDSIDTCQYYLLRIANVHSSIHDVVTRRYALHLVSLSPSLQRGFTRRATSREVLTPPRQTR